MPNPVYGVYGIFFPENHVYIGSTITNIHVRFRVHRHALQSGNHDNNKMQELWDKYGDAKFVILEDMSGKSEHEVREKEQYYIEQLQGEYTLCNEAPALLTGYALPEIIKEKISKGRREGKTGGRRRIASFAPQIEEEMSECHRINMEMRKEQTF
jgi:group I intron endonuclease